MGCEDCLAIIEEYVDGELDSKAERRVGEHLSVCASCESAANALAREQVFFSSYQRDIEITPDLWSGIQARIGKERAVEKPGFLTRVREGIASLIGTPRLSPAFAALLVAVAIGATVGVMTLMNPGNPDQQIATGGADKTQPTPGQTDQTTVKKESPVEQSRPDASTVVAKKQEADAPAPERANQKRQAAQKQLVAKPAPTPEQLIREAEQKYLSAIAILEQDIDRRRPNLDPAMYARFQVALGDINRTIQDTRRAVRENPDDPIALQYMLGAYSKKVEVLRELAMDR